MSVQEVLYFSVCFSSGKLGIYVSFQNGPSIFLTYLRWEKEAYCSSPISKQFLNILFCKTAEYVPIPKAQFHSKQAVLGGWHCYTDQMLSWLGSCEGTNNSWVTREKLLWEAGTGLSSNWCLCCWESCLENRLLLQRVAWITVILQINYFWKLQ